MIGSPQDASAGLDLHLFWFQYRKHQIRHQTVQTLIRTVDAWHVNAKNVAGRLS
jgi:hypothetical protein